MTIARTHVLDYITTYIGQHGYGPTIREIADRFSCSVSNAHRHVEKLAQQGKIVRTRRQARSIRLPSPSKRPRSPGAGDEGPVSRET